MFRMLCGAFLISFSAVFVKIVGVGPTATMFYRFLFGGLGFLILTIIKKGSLWHGWQPFALAVLTGITFSLDLFFWHRSILYIGPGLATILVNFQVFFLSIVGGLFLKERLSWQFLIAVPIAFIGIVLIVGWSVKTMTFLYRLGIFYGLMAAGCYSIATMLLHKSRRIQNRLPLNINMTIVALLGALAGSLEVFLAAETFAIPNLDDFLLLFTYGVICSGLGWYLIAGGLTTVSASKAGLILVLQPACAFIWDLLFFDRPTTAIQIFGAILTLSAIYIGGVSRKLVSVQKSDKF